MCLFCYLIFSLGMQQSDTITKKYLIIERCEKPILSHMGGTFAGTYLDSHIFVTMLFVIVTIQK